MSNSDDDEGMLTPASADFATGTFSEAYSSSTEEEKVLRRVWSAGSEVANLYKSESDSPSELQANQTWRDKLIGLRDTFYKELENYEILEQLEDHLGVRKEDLLSFFGIFLVVTTLMGWRARHWCEVVGFCYPAYATVSHLTSKDRIIKVRWLIYWVLLAFLNIIELSMGSMLLRILPFYYPFKLGLLLWCQSPKYRGSLYVHSHILAPFLKCHRAVPSIESDAARRERVAAGKQKS